MSFTKVERFKLWIKETIVKFQTKDEHEDCYTQSYGIFDNIPYKVEPKHGKK